MTKKNWFLSSFVGLVLGVSSMACSDGLKITVSDSGSDADSDADGDGDTSGDTNAGDGDNADPRCFKGVDLLLVVDNSGSMAEEQQILAAGIFTLINALVFPIEGLDQSTVSNLRVAVASTDMGLQYGQDGSIEGWPYGQGASGGCDEIPKGDDGAFQGITALNVNIASNQIRCDSGGSQCPTADWTCQTGKCLAPDDNGVTECPEMAIDHVWSETSLEAENLHIGGQVACMAQLGTEGCGVEQQLQAGVRALFRDDQKSFIRDDHLLAVIVISDEEDCSIKDNGLFSTAEWTGGGHLNTACNIPQSNADNFLLSTDHFYNSLIGLKNGDSRAVVFAAIVGVPEGDDSPCQGTGDTLGKCLAHADMKYREEWVVNDDPAVEIYNFSPACRRVTDDVVTSAAPGRRYVKVAQDFGEYGYVYSICNEDWSQAMREVADLIGGCDII